ncbi:MAG: septal ring lytic transglycosylase RlpA family protein, partial [Methylocella sp.]
MRAKRILCVSARSFAFFSRFPRKADGPVRCIVAGLAGGAAVGLCGCAQLPSQRLARANSTEYFPSSIYGPASPRVVADGEPVPRGGGMYMLGNPYTVAGLTYYPSEKHYAAIGLASWYGDAFHGRRTANGEVYDRDAISAAHPTLPLPSYARVTNLRNHYSMIVRVNDRGPFAAHRIMDVSRRAAEALDFRQTGTTPVKIEYIGAASLAGSNDQKLLATLRTDGPASLAGWQGRGRDMVAANAPSAITPAGAEPVALPAGGDASAPDSAPTGHFAG